MRKLWIIICRESGFVTITRFFQTTNVRFSHFLRGTLSVFCPVFLRKNHYCSHKTRHCTAQIWFRVLFSIYLKIGPLDSIKILYSILTVRSEDSRLLIFLFMSDWFIERLDMWTYKRSYITNHISGIFNSLLNLSALYQSFHTNHVLKCN